MDSQGQRYQQQQQNPESTGPNAEQQPHQPMLHRSSSLFERSANYFGSLRSSITKGELVVSKLFYFFFYAAFGSLFPLISIYFKQLGMNPTQAGMLVGIRPFVEFASAPFWGGLADRFRKGKMILLFSLICWIVFTLAMDFVQPTAPFCLIGNATHQFLIPALESDNNQVNKKKLVTAPALKKLSDDYEAESEFILYYLPEWYKTVRVPGLAPNVLSEEQVINYNPNKLGNLVSPPHSKKVYRKAAVEQVFLLLLVIIVVGEFFSAPAITLADACTLNMLGEHADLYGKQRMFGSLGWGISMFIVGIALDYSLVFPSHPCGLNVQEKNYTLCFAAFSILMTCAFLAATQFKFEDYDTTKKVSQRIMDAQVSRVEATVLDQTRQEVPEVKEVSHAPKWLSTVKTFATPHYATFLFVTWWMGFGVGLVFCFLFWHLQDIGGSPSLYGLASVITHISEIGAYFFSFRLINRIGHTKVLYVGLLANVGRFLYVSWLRDPWWVLPFEFVQGLTHAAVWAAATSYISIAAPPQYKSSAQGLLQGLHHGLGRGCGALFGGLIITYTGTRIMFRAYGFACLVVFILFFLVNRYLFREQVRYNLGEVDKSQATLAPHGIPMNVPFTKSENLSNNNPPGFYGTTDPTQEAYDRYVHEAYSKPVIFDELPSKPGRT